MKKILLICGLIFSTVNINAQTWNIGPGTTPSSTVTATLSDNTLIISGTGNMRNWTQTAPPWLNVRESVHTIIINYGVTSIGDRAFWLHSNFTSITIPNSVNRIGMEAFQGAVLTSLTIPNSVTEIGWGAFLTSTIEKLIVADGTSTLRLINIHPQQVVGGQGPFSSSSIDTVHLGRNVFLDGGSFALFGANTRYISLSNNLTVLPNLRNHTNLTSITIPNSINTLGWESFTGCTNLRSVVIEDGTNALTVSGNIVGWSLDTLHLGRNINHSLTVAPFGTNIQHVTIGNRVTSIPNRAFQGNTGLTSIIIPNNVTSIGSRAFEGCTGLTSIIIPSSVTTIGDSAFRNCTGLTSIVSLRTTAPTARQNTFFGVSACLYVPPASINNYTMATGWGNLLCIRAISTDNNLASLSISSGTLSPVFNPSVLSYTSSVPYSDNTITITAIPANSNATVTGAGEVSLNVGLNTFPIVVMAQNGTTRTYTINITRRVEFTYTVTFNSQGGSTVNPQTVDDGERITEPTPPTRMGYIFGGWYREVASINAWNFSTDIVTANITLFARWNVNKDLVIERLRDSISLLVSSVEPLNDSISDLHDSIRGLHQTLTACDSQNSILLVRIGTLNDSIGELNQLLLLCDNQDILQYIETLYESIKGLNQQLTTCNNQRNDLNDTITSRDNRITTLLGNISDLQGLNTTLRDSINLLFQLLADCEGTGTSNAPFIPTNQIQIYPNPVSYELRIINHEWEQDNVVELFDINGRRVFTGRGYGDVFTIDMSSFHPGNYILRIGHRVARVVRQ